MNLDGNMNPKIPPGSSNNKTHLKIIEKLYNKTERFGCKFSLYTGPTPCPVIRPPRHPVDDVLGLPVFITLQITISSEKQQNLGWAKLTASVWEIWLSISSPNMTLLRVFFIVVGGFFDGTESLRDCWPTLYFPIAGPENRKSLKDRLWAKLLSMASLATCAKFFRSWTSFVSLLV